MSKTLQRHMERVLQIISEHDDGITFYRLRDKALLITEALENCLARLKSDFRIVLFKGKYFEAKAYNQRNRNKESDKPVRSIRRAENGGKQVKKKAGEALAQQAVGGVQMLDYKLRLLRELEKHFGNTGQKAIGDDLGHIRDDLERLAKANEKAMAA